jgi:hypothetical protein
MVRFVKIWVVAMHRLAFRKVVWSPWTLKNWSFCKIFVVFHDRLMLSKKTSLG